MRKTSRTYELSFVISALEASRSFLAGFDCRNGVFRDTPSHTSNIKGLIKFQEFLIGKLIVFCFGRLVPHNSGRLQFQPVVVK